MYRSVFIFQKRGNLSHCECCVYFSTCVRDESETAFFSLSVPFRSSNDLKHLPPPPLPFQCILSYMLSSGWSPSTMALMLKKKKKRKKNTTKKKKTWYPQRETKALKNTLKTHRAPPSVHALTGGRWPALHSLARLGTAWVSTERKAAISIFSRHSSSSSRSSSTGAAISFLWVPGISFIIHNNALS